MSNQGKPVVVVASCNHHGHPQWPPYALYVLARPAEDGDWAVWRVVGRPERPLRDHDPNRVRVAQPHPAWPDSDPADAIGRAFSQWRPAQFVAVELIPVLHPSPWLVDCPYPRCKSCRRCRRCHPPLLVDCPSCQGRERCRHPWRRVSRARLVTLAERAARFRHRGFCF
jgi:hypothetical protein